MMKKKTAAIIVAAAMGMSLLTGCSSQADQQQSSGTSVNDGSSVENSGTAEGGSVAPDSTESISGQSGSAVSTPEPSSAPAEEDYDGKLVSEGFMQMDYAEGFSVELFKGGYRMIAVGEPARQYLVVPEGMRVPEGLDEAVAVLQMPVDQVYVASTNVVSLMNAIDALDCVKLVATDTSGWYIDEVTAAMESGGIVYSGSYKEPDYEMMADKGIQLHIDTTMVDSVPEVNEKFTELGIPNLVEVSSLEKHPLARVEWVKMLGVLFGREEEAQEYFDSQKALMDQATAAESSGITVAMGYITSSGKYYARNGGDYLVQMIELAGGDYICADMEPEKSGNTSMTFEEWYAAFKDADYLFYWNFGNKFYSIEEMTAYEPLLADFKAVKEGHVWVTSPDFTQATSAISSIVADMNKILFSENPDGVTTDHLIKIPRETEE